MLLDWLMYGPARFLTRGLGLLAIAEAARVPVAPSPMTKLVQLMPEHGATISASDLWAAAPVVVLVLRRPG